HYTIFVYYPSFFLITLPPPPTSPLFPYTTLFRSCAAPFQFRLAIINAPSRLKTARRGVEPNIRVIRPAIRFVSFISISSAANSRSEEHTSELQSQSNLVCRLLLEKKKKRSRTTDS